MTAKGIIKDGETREPLEGATVELWYGNVLLTRGIAGSDGRFTVYTPGNADVIRMTHVGYQPITFGMQAKDDGIEYGYNLLRDEKELEGVTIESVIKKNPGIAILAGLLLVLALANNK